MPVPDIERVRGCSDSEWAGERGVLGGESALQAAIEAETSNVISAREVIFTLVLWKD